MDLKLGFSGTRTGMNSFQYFLLTRFIDFFAGRFRVSEFHHGDCTGSDAEAHRLIAKLYPNTKIIIHPPEDPKHRAYCLHKHGSLLDTRPYLERDREIAQVCDTLLATPKSTMEDHSGTWSTIRYKREYQEKNWIVPSVVIILPEGTVQFE